MSTPLDLKTLEPLGLGASLLAFVSGFWAWMRVRAGRRAEGTTPKSLALSAEATAGAAKELVDGAVDLNAEYRRQLAFVRKDCARLARAMRKLSRQVASCEDKHTACEAKTERQDAEIERLRREFEAYTAKNPPASY